MLKGGQYGWPIKKWDQRGYKGVSDIYFMVRSMVMLKEKIGTKIMEDT